MSTKWQVLDKDIDKHRVQVLKCFNINLIDRLHNGGVCNTIFECSFGRYKYAKTMNICTLIMDISVSYIDYLEF